MRNRICFATFALPAVAVVCGQGRFAPAAAITTLYGTGVATQDPTTGVPQTLAADGAADPNYTLISAPTPDTTGPAYVTMENSFPIGFAWQADNTTTSKWISPHANENPNFGGTTNEPVGTYVYQTTFSLAGLNPASAVINGNLWADDTVSQITLNGNVSTVTGVGYASPTSFSLTSGFVGGTNTLDFYVTNVASNPPDVSGLRVAVSGTAGAAVPEPASMALLALVGLSLRRRRFVHI